MELTWGTVGTVAAATVAVNHIVGSLLAMGERRYRAGKHVQEEKGRVDLIDTRLEALAQHTASEIGTLTKNVERLVRLQDETNRTLRIMATAMGVKLTDFGTFPNL